MNTEIFLPVVSDLKSDPLGILEIAIWSPDLVQPFWAKDHYCKNIKISRRALADSAQIYAILYMMR